MSEEDKSGVYTCQFDEQPEQPRKEVAVGIHFDLSKMSEAQRALLWEATRALRAAGIGFDMGTCGRYLDWEWDWSLRGPIQVVFKNFVEDDLENRYVREAKQTPEMPLPQALEALTVVEAMGKTFAEEKKKDEN